MDTIRELVTKWVPILVRLAFTSVGKYVLPVIVGKLGVDQAQAGNWWTATAEIACAAAVAGACSAADRWFHTKPIVAAVAENTEVRKATE